MDKNKIEEAVKVILGEIGEDTEREGIKFTPTRVARLYSNLFYGYKKKLVIMNEEMRNTKVDENVIPITIFDGINSKEMLIRKVKFVSFCEHHMVPFLGYCWIGIIPENKLLGMNKIDKIVKFFASRLQVQERMTNQIADWINDNLQCKGVIVITKASHMCAELQGDEGHFTTSSVRGVFLKPEEGKTPKEEFLKLISLDSNN